MSTHPVTHSVIIDDPEIEEHYRKYESIADRIGEEEALAEVLLGDASYVTPLRMPKYNGPTNILRTPAAAVRYAQSLGIPGSKTAHHQRAFYMGQLAKTLNDAWQKLVSECCEMFGDHGPLVSGVYRSHFPAESKNRLRFLAHGETMARDALHLHRHLTKSRSPYFTW